MTCETDNTIKGIMIIVLSIALIISGFVIRDQNETIAAARVSMRNATETMKKAHKVIAEQNQKWVEPIISDSNSISLEK